MRFSEWLDLVPADRAVAVLMRHAERNPIESVRDSLEARLTAKGIKDSELLGRELSGFPRIELHHSPVERCRQTARAIATGCTDAGGNASVFGSDTILGGPYMLDWRRAMALVMERGAGWFVKKWFTGELEPGLVTDAHEAARQQLENLADVYHVRL
ncbi:MAG: histidine phosphatase family protein, partial [Deltaproteobacteria bacterium]